MAKKVAAEVSDAAHENSQFKKLLAEGDFINIRMQATSLPVR